MGNLKPVSDFKAGESPDVVWLQTKSGEKGVGLHYDCAWMREDADCDDVLDAFTWLHKDDGNHIELVDVEGWRPATKSERKRADALADMETS
jgi:hypothetical protein